jgi:L-lactate dehydrogenase complex protein LldE
MITKLGSFWFPFPNIAMTSPKRESPHGKKVSIFVTCMVDTLYPEVGIALVKLLEYLDIEVDFPRRQTCCGQPGYNGGYWEEARKVADQLLDAFQDAELIVTPSGSCAAMVRHEYKRLYAGDPKRLRQAKELAGKIWEWTEFLVDGLGITNLGARLSEPQAFAFHDSCHSLRHMGLGSHARVLVQEIENARLIDLDGHDECCGFGGLFSVKMSDVSGSMLAQKIECIERCPAQVLSLDISCVPHINGGLSKKGSPVRVRHLIEVLAEGLGL